MSNQEHKDPQDSGDESTVRRGWHQASDELPPPELDASIIAAARKSVQDRDSAATTVRDGKRSRSWLMQWQPLAAAATVAGLAFVLLQVMPRDREVIPSIRMEESAPAQSAAPPGTTEPPATERAESARSAVDAAVAEQKTIGHSAGSPDIDVPAPSAGAAVNQGAAPPASEEKRQRDAATMSPADWAARIVALYESGDVTGATDALRAFRAAEPDADSYLPESLRDWARTVK